MKIQTNTDSSIEQHEPLTIHVETTIKEALSRFSDEVLTVVVHLSEINDSKSTDGTAKCLMEARLSHHSPIAVSAHAATIHQSIHSAVEKLKRAINSTTGRIHHIDRTATVSNQLTAEDEP